MSDRNSRGASIDPIKATEVSLSPRRQHMQTDQRSHLVEACVGDTMEADIKVGDGKTGESAAHDLDMSFDLPTSFLPTCS